MSSERAFFHFFFCPTKRHKEGSTPFIPVIRAKEESAAVQGPAYSQPPYVKWRKENFSCESAIQINGLNEDHPSVPCQFMEGCRHNIFFECSCRRTQNTPTSQKTQILVKMRRFNTICKACV